MQEKTNKLDNNKYHLKVLPNNEIRQIMWRYSDNFELQMLVESTRSVARNSISKLALSDLSKKHGWNSEKTNILTYLDEAGITNAYLDKDHGGFLTDKKNLALSLIAFELSWVDAGVATTSLANYLALAPIKERGTEEQKKLYMSNSSISNNNKPWKGAFALTEPLPYVGVDTGVLSGKIRVDPNSSLEKDIFLEVEKRGRFITNIEFANYVVAAVTSDDSRIKGSCLVILHEEDSGLFDRGNTTKKLVHQLSSTGDPIFKLKVPADRIVGGYKIENNVLIPNFSHAEIIEAVFKRTRVPVSLMSASKLLSVIEPIIRYQRTRFRSGMNSILSPRAEFGLQLKEDSLSRLAEIWSTGECASSLGFYAARLLDIYDDLEKQFNLELISSGFETNRDKLKFLKQISEKANETVDKAGINIHQIENIELFNSLCPSLERYLIVDSLVSVVCPACKLWNTGNGADVMREAVGLFGGYGLTEDCPGHPGQKWIDMQLEATYEGPECVQRRQLASSMRNSLFLAWLKNTSKYFSELSVKNDIQAGLVLAKTIDFWIECIAALENTKDYAGKFLYSEKRHATVYPFTDSISWIMAVSSLVMDIKELIEKSDSLGLDKKEIESIICFFKDLAIMQSVECGAELIKTMNLILLGCKDEISEKENLLNLKKNLEASFGYYLQSKEAIMESLTKVVIPEVLDYA